MLKQTIRLVSYLLFSLLFGMIVTLTTMNEMRNTNILQY